MSDSQFNLSKGQLQFLCVAWFVSLVQNVIWWVLWSQKDKNDKKKKTFLIWAILLSINFVCILLTILLGKFSSMPQHTFFHVFVYFTILAFLILALIGSLSSFS